MKIKTTEFTIKSYSIKQLACLYFGDLSPRSASVRLRHWMATDYLKKELEKNGLRPRQRILTPIQVKVIVEHLGPPAI